MRWSLFLIELKVWWCAILSRRKTPAKVLFSRKLSEICKKTDYVEHVRTNAWVKWTTKKCIHKSYSQENTGDDILFSAVADMWPYSFSKTNSITDAFLWELWSFTEYHFYGTLLRNCFWFLVTFSTNQLLYQW